jgi:cytoskeletal protein RodZ
MTAGNKNQRHQFLNYLEDYQDIVEAKNHQEEEEKSWMEESQEKQVRQYKFSLWIYGLSGLFLLAIVFFWWNISRAQFYRALDKPLSDGTFKSFLLLLDESKYDNSDFDWKNQLEVMDTSTLSADEQQVLNDLKQKVNDGANLGDLMKDLK